MSSAPACGTTDTAGQTLATFAIFNLAGLQFSPRIRDALRAHDEDRTAHCLRKGPDSLRC